MPSVVTRLRERPRGRVEVELDGAPWRLVPADAILRSGLAVGLALDREAARTIGRELRRAQALEVAARALRQHGLSRAQMEQRLQQRGIRATARGEALGALEQAGVVDDARLAHSAAAAFAERGFGDGAIRAKLEGRGVSSEHVEAALAGIDPERERATGWAERRGGGLGAAKWLFRRGFDPEVARAVTGFAVED
ncbi:MAG: regulatory protein RecX [Gaiellaceae bacterium]